MSNVWELFNNIATTESAKTDLGYVVNINEVRLYSSGEIIQVETGNYTNSVFIKGGVISQHAPSGQLTSEDL